MNNQFLSKPDPDYYVVGGTLKVSAPSYVLRVADQQLLENLISGEYCYVLTTRQMGKSSLMVRTATRLKEFGICSAIVDLTGIGAEVAPESWYLGQIRRIVKKLCPSFDYMSWWKEYASFSEVDRYVIFVSEILLQTISSPVVLFIDEIDSTLQLPYSDDFFAAIRSLYNQRASDSELYRLTFVLLGVASPSDLIKAIERTPFNIGRRVELNDFTLEEAYSLAAGLAPDPELALKILEQIVYWTGGHPYLTQKTCSVVADWARKNWDSSQAGNIVENLVRETFLKERGKNTDDNLQFVRDRLWRESQSLELLNLYRLVIEGKEVGDDERNPTYTKLKLSGVVKVNESRMLQVRNRIYHQVFDHSWLIKILPQSIPQNIPRSGAVNFVGREQELETLHQQLQQKERVAICAIAGMGGVGKTELALQYAQSHQQQGTYPGGLCWLQAAEADVGTQIISFARVQLDVQIPDGLDLQEQVAYCWRHWRGGEVLLIFDDVRSYERIKPYLPPAEPRFKVLITTRRLGLGESFELLRLEVLSQEAAIKLLVSFVGEERIYRELDQAKQLCAELGYLPLGLELVGRYLKRKPDLSLAQMCQRLGLEHRSLQQRSEDMTARLGVAAAFELSWQELDELAQQLACLLNLFALAPIPWSLVEQCTPARKAEDLEKARDKGLLKLYLLQRVTKNTYRLHPLIREFFRAKLTQLAKADDLKQGFCKAMVAIAKQIPEIPTKEVITAVTSAIPHVAEAATALTSFLSDEDLVWPFIGLGRFYEGQGFYDQAEPWYEQCLSTTQSRFGSDHISVANSLNNLANLYSSQGRYNQAQLLYTQALELRKRLLGQKHVAVANSLNNLANLYTSQGCYAEAEPLLLEALQIWRSSIGNNHLDVATTLNNLASLYESLGRYAEAEPLLMQALEIRQHLLEQDNPDISSNLNNLANLYASQGRYAEAEPLYLQVLEIRQRLLGEEHPYVATGLNNLAELYRIQGRYAEAEPLYLQALQIRRQALGEEHPYVATCLNNLANLYASQGRYAEAESLYLQALEISRRLLGEEHPDTANNLNNLAELYRVQYRYVEAEHLYLQALEISRSLLGEEHPDIANNLNNLANLYASQSQYEKAEILYLQALNIRQKTLGGEHPDIAISLNNLATLYASQARYAEAEPLYLQALELSRCWLGEKHSYVVSSLTNLAEVYFIQRRYREAKIYYTRVLEIYEQQPDFKHYKAIEVREKLKSINL
jgi:tetratricopeptide (TPR) repeat protein